MNKKLVALSAAVFVMGGTFIGTAHAQSSMYPTYSSTDAKINELETEIRNMKRAKMLDDRYVASLEMRIAALEDRGSKPKMSRTEFEAYMKNEIKKAEAKEAKEKAQ